MEEQERSESIFEMIDSDFDSFTGSMSPEDAKRSIAQARKATADPEHIYNKSGFGHQKAVDRMNKLYQAAAPPEGEPARNEAGEELLPRHWPDKYVKAMEQGLEIQEQKKEARIAAAQKEIDVLVNEHGYQRVDIPDDVTDWQVNLLKAQRLNREEPTPDTLRELNEILEKEAHNVKFDSELMTAISSLTQARLSFGRDSIEQFTDIAERIIRKINDAHDKAEAQFEKGTKRHYDKLEAGLNNEKPKEKLRFGR